MVLNWVLDKIAWDYNQRQLNKILPLVDKINDIDRQWDWLSDEKIKAKTQEFKDMLKSWTSLDELLPQAFAAVKQACKRLKWTKVVIKWQEHIWDMVPYDVQLIWWIVLHQWKISEMRTWEWKTLVATLPLYLNALEWKWAHLVTVNDYLASRDAEWMSNIFNWLGLSVWIVVKSTNINERRAEYEKDITYVENSELWFDYLRDNLARTTQDRNLIRRPLNYAIVDEVDSILIDEARTPLIISQPSAEATDKYLYYSQIIKLLKPCKGKQKVSKWFLKELLSDGEEEVIDDGDYYIDEKHKTVSLSSTGIRRLEEILKVNNLYKDLWYQEIHHIENSLKANAVYLKDKDYLVRDNEVLIVDEHTWRVMPWRRYSEWLHQAIEAKEWVQVQKESQTLATITYQHFFKQYAKLAWMTGTATTEWEEFEKIYNLEVIAIPTNRSVIRVDKNDKVFFNQIAKWKSVAETIKFYHEMWIPILIWTSSINTSEYVSDTLRKINIQHYVLNAKYHEQEANIVSNAWKFKSVVVATNMAWRGTDIKLDKDLSKNVTQNYVTWIKKVLKWDSYSKIPAKGFSWVVFSEYEFNNLIEWIKEWFNLSDEDIRSAEKNWHNVDWKSFKIEFNKSKKNKEQAFAEILVKNTEDKQPEIDERDIHYWLFILGTEKHDSRRIDNQLRWRAWRQWDPGISQFYVALDDEIMRKMGGDKIQAIARMLLPKEELESIELTQWQFTSSIERAQKQMEWWYFGIRKHLFEYDSVINKQRQRIYKKRDEIIVSLDSPSENKSWVVEEIISFIPEVLKKLIYTYTISRPWNLEEIILSVEQIFGLAFSIDELKRFQNTEDLNDYIYIRLKEYLDDKISKVQDMEYLKYSLRNYYLEVIDRHWVNHIDDLQYLRDKVSLYWYAQEDPLIMYKKEWYDKFLKLLFNIQQETLSFLFKADFTYVDQRSAVRTMPLSSSQISFQMPATPQMSWWEWIVNALKDAVKNISSKDLAEFEQIFSAKPDASIKPEIVEVWSDDVEVFELNNWKNTPNTDKVRPNDFCPCWSWKKYKKCCGANK